MEPNDLRWIILFRSVARTPILQGFALPSSAAKQFPESRFITGLRRFICSVLENMRQNQLQSAPLSSIRSRSHTRVKPGPECPSLHDQRCVDRAATYLPGPTLVNPVLGSTVLRCRQAARLRRPSQSSQLLMPPRVGV